MTTTGKCACGAIQFQFEGEPINNAFCYCTECQKHTGSDKWFGIWVAIDKLAFTQGEPAVFERLGDSGQPVNHLFCPKCATTLCVEVPVVNIYSVSATVLDNNQPSSPNMVIYAASAPSWATFPENVPVYEKLPPDL